MFICDLHQDWSDNCLILTHKDFFKKNTINEGWNMHGIKINNQVDFYRLKEGGVNLVFGGIALLPEDIEKSENIRLDKVKEQIDFYDYIVKKSNGSIKEILNQSDVNNLITNSDIGVIKNLEGFYYFNEKDKNFEIIDYFYKLGVRSIAPTWNIDNNLAGGGNSTKGLTENGKKFIEKIKEKKIIFDIAHISKNSFWDIINYTDYPMIMSHTQLRSINNHIRNINDNQAKAIADKGGIIGLMPHTNFLGSNKISDYIYSIKYLVNLVGIEHVGIGSDFDGTTTDKLINNFSQASDFKYFPELLKKEGMDKDSIEKILGKNIQNFILNIFN